MYPLAGTERAFNLGTFVLLGQCVSGWGSHASNVFRWDLEWPQTRHFKNKRGKKDDQCSSTSIMTLAHICFQHGNIVFGTIHLNTPCFWLGQEVARITA